MFFVRRRRDAQKFRSVGNDILGRRRLVVTDIEDAGSLARQPLP